MTTVTREAQELQKAFDVFNQVSLALSESYQALQTRVESLTNELAVANGELRRQYEEKEALSERLALLLDALPAGVVVLDGEARVSEANPAARALFGLAVIGRRWPELARQQLAATEAPDEWLCAARRLAITESALDSAGGRILLIHDVTAAHALKSELERNRRLAAMGEMAAALAHQLRTPLATALLYSANLAQAELGAAARVRFAEKATAQLKRLERLIQDVLLFARGERIGRDRVSLRELFGEATQSVEALFREQGVSFRVLGATGEAGAALIVGSRKALAGALVNLLENALQACSAGGDVTLAGEWQAGQVAISVRDSGAGIAPEIQGRIFEPFFTTRGQGTGLGLAIALAVVRSHGGTMQLRSVLGHGCEFVITLPSSPAGEAIDSTDESDGT
ncbi:MAG TPA: ATP-binding protein [Accumulibacter sp.]|uniref:sensor histidine kinase n=1 Tax=Accumulibacter sp. TaxID=2053492 RepID=UPI0028795B2D|nr:ATP-binding protein [Accumulibacter sp.]MDS4053647.1 ATP-binding protein [Accumulibacter sp.]HMV06971.1 ATP-binding protein [Accumulibacter sp.]HMW63443.1 ATP-binding protein [Accumulibacter sp.]HMW79137.1 ATP-binding protein [Accumulibacter sp.]HMX69872.1 ATP-binding protein [Accumulibacter sp.]